jgi:hypothetical protein
VPDCDLTAPERNGECGAIANAAFGTATATSTYNSELLSGWGIRAYNWEFSAGIQHELLPRVSADVSFFRRSFGNFFVSDNRATAPSDYTQFSIVVPNTDSRLPTAGQTLGGFYDLNPDKVGQVDNYVTRASDYGDQHEVWTGVDVTVNARLRNGLLIQGGTSTGRTSLDSCEIRQLLPETDPTNPFCDAAEPFQTQVKFLASYTIPRVDVQVSGTLQNIPGPIADANFNASNVVVQPSLGRPLSGGAANVTLSLIAPSSLRGDRVNQLDLRIGKVLRFGPVRASVNLDMFNALNGAAVLALNNTFGATTPWQVPRAILQARTLRVSSQIDF